MDQNRLSSGPLRIGIVKCVRKPNGICRHAESKRRKELYSETCLPMRMRSTSEWEGAKAKAQLDKLTILLLQNHPNDNRKLAQKRVDT
eukprot:6204718-Pleurochrysis_carterae.AAC.2